MQLAAQEPKVVAYRARNLVNGKTYIGFTTQGLRQRENEHRWTANSGKGWLLHAAMRKHGHENIVFETIFDFDGDEEMAKLYEIEAIAAYRPEYNISRGGDGGSVHPNTARKISEANKGRPSFLKGKKFSPEALAKFRETKARNGKPAGNTGKKASPEKLAKMRLAALGKPSPTKGKKYSEEVRERMRAAARTRRPPTLTDAIRDARRENIRKAHEAIKRPVQCLTDGKVFASARDADRFYGLRLGSVIKGVNGDCKTVRGMTFVRHEAKDGP